jgi:hypothetical protein
MEGPGGADVLRQCGCTYCTVLSETGFPLVRSRNTVCATLHAGIITLEVTDVA